MINLQEMNVAVELRAAGKFLIITLGRIPVDHSKCPRKPMFTFINQHIKCLTFKMHAALSAYIDRWCYLVKEATDGSGNPASFGAPAGEHSTSQLT